MERRLSRLKGEVNTDERQVLEAKVAELKKTLEEKKNAYNVLHAQHKKVQVTCLQWQILEFKEF